MARSTLAALALLPLAFLIRFVVDHSSDSFRTLAGHPQAIRLPDGNMLLQVAAVRLSELQFHGEIVDLFHVSGGF